MSIYKQGTNICNGAKKTCMRYETPKMSFFVIQLRGTCLTDDRLWRNHTGEIAPLCCTELIFTRAGGQCLIPPVVVH